MSWRNIGVYARWRSRRGASSGGCGGIESGNSPNTRAFMRSLLRPGCVSRLRHLCDTGEEHVDLVRLERGDVLHVGAVHLEAVALDRVDDRLRDRLGWLERAVVERRVVVGQVPDLGGDRSG